MHHLVQREEERLQAVGCTARGEQLGAERRSAHQLVRSAHNVEQVAHLLAGAAALARPHVDGSSHAVPCLLLLLEWPVAVHAVARRTPLLEMWCVPLPSAWPELQS